MAKEFKTLICMIISIVRTLLQFKFKFSISEFLTYLDCEESSKWNYQSLHLCNQLQNFYEK